MTLEGTGVVVTGASRGLGFALARSLAREGAHVVMVARGADELERAARAVREEAAKSGLGGKAYALACDVGEKEAIHRIAGVANALAAPVEIFVNAASTLGPLPMPLLLDTECEDFERVLAVNLVGPFRLAKALAGPMLLRGRGLVVLVSSDAAVTAYPRWGAYGISKAAQDHLARSLAAELDPVRVHSVDPGEMDTTMHAAAMPDADRSTLADPADVASRIMALVVHPERAPNGARVLASDFAPYRNAERTNR